VIDLIREISGDGQALFTSHSPYVLEEFEPEEMTVLSRTHATGAMSGTAVTLPHNLKRKMFKEGMRTRFAEALLARRVLICEGKSETIAYPYVGKLARQLGETEFGRLDTDGWAVLDATSETNVAPLAEFFRGLGKQVVTIFDEQDSARRREIHASSDLAIEQPYKGFEDLLIAEVPASSKRQFVDRLIADGAWPAHVPQPAGFADDEYDKALRKLLTKTKGEPTAIDLLSTLSLADLPVTITAALRQIRLITVPLPENRESHPEVEEENGATASGDEAPTAEEEVRD
jgi:putative ATP-dependent endonuclease of OLD family